MKEVAEGLNEEWRGGTTRVLFIPEYYSGNGFREWLQTQGEVPEDIGRHAGITDTSQMMYVAPEHIRLDKRVKNGGFEGSGVTGDPTKASAEYGKKGIELKVETTVKRIRELTSAER